MQFTRIVKGSGYKYVIGNNVFSQYCVRSNKRYVKCDMCGATGYIEGDTFTEVKQHTQHEDMTDEIRRMQLLERCRKRAAEEPTHSLRHIFDTETHSAGNEAGVSVAFGDVESSMYKRRRLQLPTLPKHANDVTALITGTRFEMCDGQPFFRGTVSSDMGTACIFASTAQMELLSASSAVHFDGTFKTVPRQFYQLFTIFVAREQYLFPVCFIIMTGKSKNLYIAVFNKLKSLVPEFSPANIMADFEDASVLAFKEVYGQSVEAEGCWFHFAQAVVRKAKKIGLSSAFTDDAEAGKCIRCITCLPLLPPNDIQGALSELETFLPQSSDSNKPLLRRLLDYVRRSWLLKSSIGPTRLSVVGRVHRTNNGVESFHNCFGRLVKVCHPSFYAFVEYLQEVTVSNMADVQRLNRGGQIRRPKKKQNLLSDKLIRCAVARYSSGGCTIKEFLCSVSHCCDNVTRPLSHPDDTGSSTEEYDLDDVDDNIQSPVISNNSPASTVVTASASASCDVCLNAPRVTVAFVPCGHATFCQQCIDTLIATNSNCPVCRGAISTTVRFYN
jgi:hypothetical protein